MSLLVEIDSMGVAVDVEHCLFASKVIADQVPIEHERDEKDQAKNIE